MLKPEVNGVARKVKKLNFEKNTIFEEKIFDGFP